MPVVLARSWGGPIHWEEQKFGVGTESQRGQAHQPSPSTEGYIQQEIRVPGLVRELLSHPETCPERVRSPARESPEMFLFIIDKN